MQTLNKIHQWFINGMLILCGILILVSIYWFFWDPIFRPVWNVKEEQIQTEKMVYHVGDEIFANSPKSCKLLNLVANREVWLVDGYKVQLSSETKNMGVGCRTKESDFVLIPSFAPSGTYHLEGTFTYQLNPIKKVVLPFRTNDFKIINPLNN